MMVLSRKKNEGIAIGDDVTVTVLEIRGDKVRLAITCPSQIPVHRQEVYEIIHGRRTSKPLPRSPEELAFLQGILEEPDDEGIRLIFADWLEEHGNILGEFIRIQCQLHCCRRGTSVGLTSKGENEACGVSTNMSGGRTYPRSSGMHPSSGASSRPST